MGADGSQFREFRMMLETKERELITLCDQQIESLHSQIREKENVVADLNAQISQLQDDFKYNLSLLDARDAELAQYDVSTAALQASVAETEERLKVARKALAEAHTLRLQEKARAEELEQLNQQKISELEKEMESLRDSKEELQARSKQELESTRTELKDLLTEKEEEIEKHKRELKEVEAESEVRRKKIAEIEAQVAESAEKLRSAEKKVQAAEASLAQHEKDLEAACESHKKDADAASQREEQLQERGSELRAWIDKQDKELQAMGKQLKELKEEKEAEEKAAELESEELKEQLQEMKSHHKTAVDQFKEEINSLRTKWEAAEAKRVDEIAEFAERTRATEAELGRLRKQLEEKDQEQRDLEEKHTALHNRYADLQKESAVNRAYEQMVPQRPGPTGGGSRSSSSLPAPSPLMSPGFSHDEEVRMDQGKTLQLEAENRQLQARCQDLSLQNDRIREVVGNMRSEMEALQKQTTAETKQAKSPPVSPRKSAGLRRLKDEVDYLKERIQGMAEELGGLRAGSPIHCRRPPESEPRGHSASPKRRATAPTRRPHSPPKARTPSRARSPESPPSPAPMRTSPKSSKAAVTGDQASKIAELEVVQESLRAQLEATSVDMTRIANERDLLMELSNSLRADLTKILQSSGAGDYQASSYGHDAHIVYGGAPPSMPAQLQREFDPGEIPRNAKLMAGMSTSYDVAHARPRTTSPHHTRFAPHSKPADSGSKQWSYGVAPGASKEVPEVSRLQMEGIPYLPYERPQGVENDALHKGTASQRARFKAAMKRKDDLSRPRVRNWNIKDDHPLDT